MFQREFKFVAYVGTGGYTVFVFKERKDKKVLNWITNFERRAKVCTIGLKILLDPIAFKSLDTLLNVIRSKMKSSYF